MVSAVRLSLLKLLLLHNYHKDTVLQPVFTNDNYITEILLTKPQWTQYL
ncbi:hypothetical protein Cmaq_1627 [Caldivirga maquilingensis IC-167]|uniref:Uncharacterized protein n=1 Tax=Caldivirga maquilingensis (strain ATCC 700844 / DSM 13496 / JCM 10307 / IC-167) TaxID=397948 RepID=A8M9X9_CALMQ|nr:hypothetical protein Cmaq_1627 [Caldivirga maquilingensis IC-167]